MPNFLVNGLSQLEVSLDLFKDGADEMVDEILNAQADVVVPAQKRTASTMLVGPYYKGVISRSIQKDKVKPYKEGKRINVKFQGKVVDEYHVRGERVATIAYINEYGKTGQPARPFIATANEECAAETVQAAMNVIDKHIKKI